MTHDRDSDFKAEVDAVVRRWAAGDEHEYWRLWKKLGNASMDKTQGDAVKKSALKRKLMERAGGRCEDCQRRLSAGELQMHRLDSSYAQVRTRNFGYFEENVVLCARPATRDVDRLVPLTPNRARQHYVALSRHT